MKLILFFLLLTTQALSQTPHERRDTIHGMALVIDSVVVYHFVEGDLIEVENGPDIQIGGYYEPIYQPTASVWPAYAVTRYILIVDAKGDDRPTVTGVNYYRNEDCVEIPVKRLFYFKQQ